MVPKKGVRWIAKDRRIGDVDGLETELKALPFLDGEALQ